MTVLVEQPMALLGSANDVINRPCVAKAVLHTTLLLINSLSDSWFAKISLLRCHASMVGNGAFSHKID